MCPALFSYVLGSLATLALSTVLHQMLMLWVPLMNTSNTIHFSFTGSKRCTTYVSSYRCVPVPMCPRTNVFPYLCFPIPMCPRTYVSPYRCALVRMCPRTYVSPYRCIPVPMCPRTYVSLYRCIPIPTCTCPRTG